MVKYAIIGVEGPHDQAFVGKVLRKFLKFETFTGEKENLDKFWEKFIPKYPKKGNLYNRLDMPSILFKDSISVAVYAGEGSNLVKNMDDILWNNYQYQSDIAAFGIVADADKKTPETVVEDYYNCLVKYFPNFPKSPEFVDENMPRTGIYVLPDNASQGVLDTLLCQCGEAVYPEYMERAKSYLAEFSDDERKKKPLKWKPFDREKALIATVVSVLKPGKTNTVSIADNDWVSDKSQNEVAALKSFIDFLTLLLEDSDSSS